MSATRIGELNVGRPGVDGVFIRTHDQTIVNKDYADILTYYEVELR